MDGGQSSLGQTIRELRRAHGMTLQKLGEQIGRTAGFISQVERGLARPSVATIEKLGSALGVSSSFFFNDPVPKEDRALQDIVTRSANRRSMVYDADWVDGDGFTDHLLSPKLSGNMLVKHTRLAPLGGWSKSAGNMTYDVAIYVLDGTLLVTVDGRTFTLSQGDFTQYSVAPADAKRKFHNPSETQATELVFVTSPALLET